MSRNGLNFEYSKTARGITPGGFQLVEKLGLIRNSCYNAGGARGGKARLELNQMPR